MSKEDTEETESPERRVPQSSAVTKSPISNIEIERREPGVNKVDTETEQIKITGRPKKLLKELRAQIGGNQLQFSDNVTTIKPNTEIERRQPKVNKVNTEPERRQPKVNKVNTEQAGNTDFKGARIHRDHKAVQS